MASLQHQLRNSTHFNTHRQRKNIGRRNLNRQERNPAALRNYGLMCIFCLFILALTSWFSLFEVDELDKHHRQNFEKHSNGLRDNNMNSLNRGSEGVAIGGIIPPKVNTPIDPHFETNVMARDINLMDDDDIKDDDVTHFIDAGDDPNLDRAVDDSLADDKLESPSDAAELLQNFISLDLQDNDKFEDGRDRDNEFLDDSGEEEDLEGEDADDDANMEEALDVGDDAVLDDEEEDGDDDAIFEEEEEVDDDAVLEEEEEVDDDAVLEEEEDGDDDAVLEEEEDVDDDAVLDDQEEEDDDAVLDDQEEEDDAVLEEDEEEDDAVLEEDDDAVLEEDEEEDDAVVEEEEDVDDGAVLEEDEEEDDAVVEEEEEDVDDDAVVEEDVDDDTIVEEEEEEEEDVDDDAIVEEEMEEEEDDVDDDTIEEEEEEDVDDTIEEEEMEEEEEDVDVDDTIEEEEEMEEEEEDDDAIVEEEEEEEDDTVVEEEDNDTIMEEDYEEDDVDDDTVLEEEEDNEDESDAEKELFDRMAEELIDQKYEDTSSDVITTDDEVDFLQKTNKDIFHFTPLKKKESPVSIINKVADTTITDEEFKNELSFSSLLGAPPPKQNKNKLPQRIAFLGERNSGTRWMYEELTKCFPTIKVTPRLIRWKHWFQEDDHKSHNPVLVIAQFRNVFEWTEAMRQVPHHSPYHLELDWKEFVTKPWTMPRPKRDKIYANSNEKVCFEKFRYDQLISCVEGSREDKDYKIWQKKSGYTSRNDFSGHKPFYELQQDGSGEPFGSILEMRAAKIKNFLSVQEWGWVQDSIPVQYEQLLAEGTDFLMSQVESKLGITRNCEAAPPQERKKRTLSREYLTWMRENVDWETEKLIGYTKDMHFEISESEEKNEKGNDDSQAKTDKEKFEDITINTKEKDNIKTIAKTKKRMVSKTKESDEDKKKKLNPNLRGK